jgi:dCMP deaminase
MVKYKRCILKNGAEGAITYMKRDDYISWDEYFMGIAMLSAERSKDENTQVGACIVDENNKIVSLGYNGMPIGCSDDVMPWAREGEPLDTKYMYVCHAELNAILNSRISPRGARIYVTLFPCNECAKAIIQSGICEVVYLSDKYDGEDNNTASKKMFDMVGVKYREYRRTGRSLTLNL